MAITVQQLEEIDSNLVLSQARSWLNRMKAIAAVTSMATDLHDHTLLPMIAAWSGTADELGSDNVAKTHRKTVEIPPELQQTAEMLENFADSVKQAQKAAASAIETMQQEFSAVGAIASVEPDGTVKVAYNPLVFSGNSQTARVATSFEAEIKAILAEVNGMDSAVAECVAALKPSRLAGERDGRGPAYTGAGPITGGFEG
jgi:uncharacterized protein YukE